MTRPISFIFFSILFFCLTVNAQAQTDSASGTLAWDTSRASCPDEVPSFPDLNIYLGENLKTRKIARQNGVKGEVIVTFFIELDGTTADISIIDSLCEECDAEVIRFISSMTRWKPAIYKCKPVKSKVRIAIPFKP